MTSVFRAVCNLGVKTFNDEIIKLDVSIQDGSASPAVKDGQSIASGMPTVAQQLSQPPSTSPDAQKTCKSHLLASNVLLLLW